MRHFAAFVMVDMLMRLRLLSTDWHEAIDAFIDEKIESGVMIVVGYNKRSSEAWDQRERRSLATQVVFLQNITKVGRYACSYAVNLVVVEIPEGVESIGDFAFRGCKSLTTVSFPTTLINIGGGAFSNCSSLDNVDLLHTQLQEIGDWAFHNCSNL